MTQFKKKLFRTETPIFVIYEFLKNFAGINNRKSSMIRFKITGNFCAGEVFRVLHALWGPADVNFCPKLWIMISFHGKKSISNLALFSALKIHANWWLKGQFLCPRNVWILYSKHDLDALGYCNLIFSNSVRKRNYWRWF